ncbi:hypothetical protein HU200_054951 [Digitaria exilis]|uniref:KIB1-4 beta-propeller domain-containing protein n=1 Tax=Digitaria exilis TaxID=1010633 RepID=A0A835AJN7_9POAL|nr:hypothetical protein HU200_054951 [Digitaria exilis]CAB3475025.1 unnamed protein product [Digitaria exilis]
MSHLTAGSCSWRLAQPRSGPSIPLPAMERELPENWKCYLSDLPTAPSCVVLVLHMDEPKFLYCRVGDDHWSEHEYDIGDVKLPRASPRKIFYFHETAAKLGAIDFSAATPKFSFMDYQLFPDGSNCTREYMMESRGELFSIYIFLKGFTSEIMMVKVSRIDPSGPRLCEVGELGDRVFLLSYPNRQLFCSASKYGLKGNQVYFNHNVTGELDGGFLYIYDMEDKRLETVRPYPEVDELLGNPFWMLPTD